MVSLEFAWRTVCTSLRMVQSFSRSKARQSTNRFNSAYLCVPLRLCGECTRKDQFTAEAQRNAEIRRESHYGTMGVSGDNSCLEHGFYRWHGRQCCPSSSSNQPQCNGHRVTVGH